MKHINRIREIVFDAFFIALIFTFTFVSYLGYIPLFGVSLTTMHILVLIGTILFGTKKGALYGFMFGLSSFLRSLLMPSAITDFYFRDPFISILPRILFGLISGLTFDYLKKHLTYNKFLILAPLFSLILTLIHSILTLTSLYLFGILDIFKINSLIGVDTSSLGLTDLSLYSYLSFLGLITLEGAIGESILSFIIITPLYIALRSIEFIKEKDDIIFKKEGINMKDIDFKKLVKPYEKEALETLIKDVSINSTYDKDSISNEAPYGKGVKECFDLLKEIAIKDGFNVDTCDNRCLEISYGSGKNLIYVLAHQDVVPASKIGWESDPFTPTLKDDRLYGRGTSDDKGPGISAYYALKALKENNLIDDYRVRLVFGGDEERGSSCLKYYFDTLKKEEPTFGFTPDGDFPLIYGEKGITNYYYDDKVEFDEIIEINAGTVINSVIDSAIVKLKNPDKLEEYLKKRDLIKYKRIDKNTFEFIGKAAHGSLPEEGINAGIILLSVLGDCFNYPYLSLLANEYSSPFGKNLNCEFTSKNLGKTTYNVGTLTYKNNEFKMGVNFRYPETVDPVKTIEKIKEVSPFKIKYEKGSDALYYDPETPFIKLLANIYEEETLDKINKMKTIGGGTYAKEAKNTVAFGSNFPGKIDHIHEANEKIDLEDFYTSMSLYARAIYSLGKLKNED